MSIEWIRPSGTNITTNDEKATILHAESLGWSRANQAAEQKETKKIICHLDKHLSIVNAMSDKDSITKYIEDVFATKLDKRGSLETVKNKATTLIAGVLSDD